MEKTFSPRTKMAFLRYRVYTGKANNFERELYDCVCDIVSRVFDSLSDLETYVVQLNLIKREK